MSLNSIILHKLKCASIFLSFLMKLTAHIVCKPLSFIFNATVISGVVLPDEKKYGIRGTEHCWFTSYLTGRKQASLCNNMLSSLCEVRSGVPQG